MEKRLQREFLTIVLSFPHTFEYCSLGTVSEALEEVSYSLFSCLNKPSSLNKPAKLPRPLISLAKHFFFCDHFQGCQFVLHANRKDQTKALNDGRPKSSAVLKVPS